MRVFRFHDGTGFRLGIESAGELFDLTSVSADFSSIASWLSSSNPLSLVLDAATDSEKQVVGSDVEFAPPIDEQEVWASGVTYLRSKFARMGESSNGGDFYDKVYAAEPLEHENNTPFRLKLTS